MRKAYKISVKTPDGRIT